MTPTPHPLSGKGIIQHGKILSLIHDSTLLQLSSSYSHPYSSDTLTQRIRPESTTMTSPFDLRPTTDYFISSPLLALIYPLHHTLLRLREPKRLQQPLLPTESQTETKPPTKTENPEKQQKIRVVCISDTHSLQPPKIPKGDLLIHSGDLCNNGTIEEIQQTINWIKTLPHPKKVVISGNHDGYFDPKSRCTDDDKRFMFLRERFEYQNEKDRYDGGGGFNAKDVFDWGDDIYYLEHDCVTISFPPQGQVQVESAEGQVEKEKETTKKRTLTIYGAPNIPEIVKFGPEHAFTYPPNKDIWKNTIHDTNNDNIDILITHTPPQSHLDLSPVYSTGCPYLLSETWRIRPKLHVFGHIHAGYGCEPVFWDEAQIAWERLCHNRRGRSSFSSGSGKLWYGFITFFKGLLFDLIDLPGWVDVIRVLGFGFWGVLYGNKNGCDCSWMVNAACMYQSSGRLGNFPQVFDI